MYIKSGYRKLLGSIFGVLLLISFFLTPLLSFIPLTSAAPSDWWNTSWSYRKSVTINRAKVGGTLANFPVLIDITDLNLASSAQSDGDDIVFVDASSSTKLNHQVEYFDQPSGHLVAWVSVPFLSSTADTVLHMYYGNPMAENQQNPTAVWDPNYIMVQHLNETYGSICYDSTINGNSGALYNIFQGASGKIDGAYEFNGATSYVEIPHGNTLTGFTQGFTASAWLKFGDIAKRESILHKYDTMGNRRGWFIEYRTDVGRAIALLASPDGANFDWWYAAFNPVLGTWYYLTVVWQANAVPKFYINGQQVATVRSGTIPRIYNNVGVPLHIGKSTYSSGREFKGVLDETHLSNAARSSSWILTSYNNQKDPSTFYAIGAEENQGGGIMISDENPRNGAINVYTNPELSIHAINTAGRPMTIMFNTNASGTWKETKHYSNVGNGIYSCIPTDMKNLGTKYYWSVDATDGTNSAYGLYSFTTTTTILSPKWTRSGFPIGESGVLIADVNGDGLEEVIKAGAGWIHVLNGKDGSVLWQRADSSLSTMAKPQMADLNHDGTLEIIVNIAHGVMAIHANDGTIYWKRNDVSGGNHWSSPVVADIDGNGYPTVFVASEDVTNGANGLGRVSSLSYDGQLLHQIFAWRPCFGGLSLADADNDGHFELFMGDRNSGYGDGGYGRGVRCFWAENLTVRWERPEVLCSSHCPVLADVNKDGRLEVMAGQNGGFYVLDSRDGSIIHHASDPNSFPIHFQPSAYDIDLDGNPEMLMADGHDFDSDDVVIWDLTQWKEDGRVSVGECFYGPKAADVTGDGIMEIIAASYAGVHVFDKNYNLIAEATNLGGPPNYNRRLTYAVVQDMDGDGYNELVVSSYDGSIFAFDTPARRPNPRPRSEVQHYSEQRLGAAEYVPLHAITSPMVSDPTPLDGATNVPVALSQLSFNLADFQNDKMNYTVTTTPYIGSGSGINVANGIQTVTISNLAYETTYTWKVNVTDGKHWTNKTYTFTTQSLPPWWNTDWQYRRVITIDPSKVSSDQTDFPVVIDLTDDTLPTKAQPDGDDFVFTDANNVKLNHEIESYDHTTGHLIAWVNVPYVSSTTQTILYMYYGNQHATNQENPPAVWDTSNKLVLHLSETHECRFWGMIAADTLPHDVVLDHLINMPYSLEALSTSNRDGWGIAYYTGTDPTVLRGPQPAYLDPNYDLAVNQMANSGAWIGVAHIRTRSSGAIPSWGNPHPFMRYKNGKWWAFGHNGNLNKDNLKNLIGPEYLAANPPTVGTSWDSSDVVDSDLYGLYVLKCIEANGWNATLGIAQAIKDITSTDSGAANFFLTDGETLWGFRKGNTLEYYYTAQYSAIASQHPTSTTSGWISLSDYNLITLKRGAAPSIISDIRQLYPLLVDSDLSNSIDSADLRANSARQDWYESRNDDPTLLTLDTSNVGGNTGKKAKFTASSTKNAYLTQEFSSPQTGTFSVQWDIYVDSIIDISGNPDRAGIMLIGDDSGGTNGPNSADGERFVFLAFYKDGGATSGTVELVWMDTFSIFTPIASVNLDQWYTIKVVLDLTADTYDVYLDGVYIATVPACTAKTSVTHISFAQWNDGAGAFYVDNIFSPAADRYKLTITTGGSGSVIVNPADSSYAKGTVVTLTASPSSGWMFSGWSGDISGNTNPITITMDGAKTVIASFTEMLLVDSEFNDSPNSDSLRTNAAGQDWYESRGDVPTLLFLDESNIGENTGKKAGFIASSTGNAYLSQEFSSAQTGVFSVQWDIYVDSILDISDNPDRAGWMMIGDDSGGTNGPNYPGTERFVVMAFYKDGGGTTGTMDLVARERGASWTAFTTIVSGLYLKQWYTIKVVCNLDTDMYDIYVDGEYKATVTSYNAKTSVTHISFAQWNDGAGAFYVDNVFAPAVDRYKLTVNVIGNGSVTVNPGESTYAAGTEVTLTAIADPGFVFAGWSGDLIDHINPITITMDSDKVVNATFIQPQYYLTINIIGSGSVTKDPDKVSYNYGESVTLTASPGIGWAFQYWTGDLTGNENPATIIMDGDKTITARFVQTGTCVDSTLKANDGTLYGGVTQGTTGKIDGAYTFDGVNDYIEIPHSDSLSGFTEAFTLSFWLRLDNVNKRQTIINKYNTAGNQRAWYIEFQNHATYGRVLSFFASADGSNYREWHTSFNPTAGAWYYITVVWESGKIPRFYINGIQTPTIGTSTLTQIYNNINTPLRIGRCPYDNARYLQGSLDEIRISNPARSADYILTSYNNQKDPSTFYAIGEEESLPAQPFILDPYPADGATNIPITLTELSFNITDYQGDLMTYYVSTYPDIGGDSATGVSNGRYTVTISGLQYQTTYTWHVNVTDGTNWTNRTYTFTTVGELLVDPEFNDSTNSEDLRTNSPEQDWYESRNNVPTLLYLDESDVGGNTGKKAGFTASSSGNAYLTQEFKNPQTGTFTVQWDIYVDSILDISGNPDRAGIMLIGSDLDGQKGPSSTDTERFVFLAFYKDGGATSGTAQLVWMDTFSVFYPIASVNLDQWYTIKVVVNVTAGKYEVYIDGQYIATVDACTKLASVTHISFAQWNDGAGAFYIDNVYASTVKQFTLTVNIVGNGQVQREPDQATYTQGTEVKLTAIPTSGWNFTGWSGDLTGTENPATILMNSNKTITATFTKVANEPPVVSNPQPSDGATNVPVSISQLNFTISDPDGDLMDYYVSTTPDIGSKSQTGIHDGTYNLTVSNLAYGTTYKWWINVTDGTHWTNMSYTFTTESPLLVDSEFNDSVDSADLRANGAGQDWYESRAQVPTLLFLDESDVGGNTGKKAGFTASSTGNAYLSQEFSSAQTGTFSVQWDIYVDSILAVSPYRAGQMLIGRDSGSGPNRNSGDRFVYLAYYKSGGGTSGTMDLVAPGKITVATGLNLKQWYTIKVVINMPAKTYDVYVDGVFKATVSANAAITTITHISFAQWNDGAGAFYVDNVFAPALDRYKLTVNKEGDGSVEIDPGESTYAKGAIVTLTAVPADGWNFSGWSGDLTGTGNPVNITMDGNKVVKATFTYINTPPEASNLSISPEHPTTTDDLVANYTYYDAEGDPEDGTEIRWYKNGALQVDLNGTLTVPSYLTQKGDIWYFTVRPKDGKVFGELVQSPSITIENTPPTIDNYYPLADPVISEGETQLFNVSYSDPDNDIASVVWFVNESQVWIGDEYTFIADYESEGIYSVTVIVQDASFTSAIKTWILTIHGTNRAPIIDSWDPYPESIAISENENQTFTITYHDPDNDSLTVEWFVNNTLTATGDTFIFEAVFGSAGKYNITIVINDPSLATATHTWTLTVHHVNRPPVIETYSPEDLTPEVNEGESIGFNHTSSDPDGDPLSYIWLLDGGEQATTQNWTYSPLYDAAEYYNVTLIVSDGQLTASIQWNVTVIDVNRLPSAPTIDITPAEPSTEDNLVCVITTPSIDPDGDIVTYIYQWYKDDVLQTELIDNTVPYSYTRKGETWKCVVIPFDGKGYGPSAEAEVTIQNSPPRIETYTPVETSPSVNEGEDLEFTHTSTDPDGDTLTYEWLLDGAFQSADQNWTYTPNYDSSGNHVVKLIVSDGSANVSQEWNVTVVNVNRPPKIDSYSPTTDPTIIEGDTQEFSISPSDPDGDDLLIQWYLNGTPTSTEDTYTFTSNYASAGIYNITVTVSDGLEQTTYQWTLTVTDVGPTLDMPFNTDESPVAVDCSGYGNNGTIYGATWTTAGNGAYYFDGNDYIEVPDSPSLDGSGTWTEITIEFWIRPTQYEKAIRLIEKRSAGSSYQIGFQTNPSAGVLGNQLYWNVWTTTGYKEIVAPFGLEPGVWSHVVCTYKDGVGMAIYVNGNLAVNASHTGTITDSTCPLNIGRYGGASSSYFTGLLDDIKIYTKALPLPLIQQNYDSSKDAHGNLAPIIISYSPTNTEPVINEGESLEFTHISSDPDYDLLTYSWILDNNPQATTQNWLYTTDYDDAGFHNITLIVSDGKLSTTQYWNVTVLNVNQAPVITDYYPDTNPTISEGQSQEFNIVCSDPDEDALLIQWYLNNFEVGTTNSTSYTFPPSSAGTYHVAVKVSDGLEIIWQNWTLTVTSGNLPPVIDSYHPAEDPTILEGQSQEFNVTYHDPNSDPLTVQWYLNGTPTTTANTYVFNANYTSAGIYNVTVVIFDGELSTEHEWVLTVIDQLLVDSLFNDSADSADLRANNADQDWYESRAQVSTLLYLDESDVGGNTGKKAGFTASSSGNAYLTQEFSSPQTGTFTVRWDIYVDSIITPTQTTIYRAGIMMIGSTSASYGPNRNDVVRFVFLAFYKDGGGTSGPADLVAMSAFGTFTTVASGLNLDQWYTIRVVVDVAGRTYDVYVDGVYKGSFAAVTAWAQPAITHISFAQWNDGAGAFYVDNVFAFANGSLGGGGGALAAGNTNHSENQQEINVAYSTPIYLLITVLVGFNLRKNKRKRK
jgi:predicted glutamine amidotransferase